MSPIRGLSDRLRLPRRGKIRLGEKKKSEKTGKTYPVSLDYFVVPDEVKAIYSNKPRKLDIMIPMEDRDSFFPQWYRMYGSSKGLLCRGNGEVAMRLDPETGDMAEIECAGKNCEYFKGKKIKDHMYRCNTIGNLQVILPKIKGLGVYQIDTSSYNSIVNLNSGIEMIRGMMGRISWIPLILEVNIQEAHPTVGGKKITTTIPVMTITADVTPEELLKQRLPAGQQIIGLKSDDELIKELAKPKVEIVNPDIDKKPDLLYHETDQEKDENEIERIKLKKEEEKKAGEIESTAEEEKKALKKKLEAEKEQETKAGNEQVPQDVELTQEIQALFDELGWPVGRRIIWQNKGEYDGCKTIEGMTKLRDDLKKRIEDEKQGNLFKQGE